MTRADIVSSVRGLLDDSEFDAAKITEAANWLVYELANNNRLRMFETSKQLYGSAGDTEVRFPRNMLVLIKEGFYLITPQVINIGKEYIPYGDFMINYANFATASQQQARTWTDFGNRARFAAPLNAEHVFQCDFIREPVPMESDQDECEIPDRYAELVSLGTFKRILKQNEDYAEAIQEDDDLQPLLTTFIRNEARGGLMTGPNVIRTNRGRGSWRADRDM